MLKEGHSSSGNSPFFCCYSNTDRQNTYTYAQRILFFQFFFFNVPSLCTNIYIVYSYFHIGFFSSKIIFWKYFFFSIFLPLKFNKNHFHLTRTHYSLEEHTPGIHIIVFNEKKRCLVFFMWNSHFFHTSFSHCWFAANKPKTLKFITLYILVQKFSVLNNF